MRRISLLACAAALLAMGVAVMAKTVLSPADRPPSASMSPEEIHRHVNPKDLPVLQVQDPV